MMLGFRAYGRTSHLLIRASPRGTISPRGQHAIPLKRRAWRYHVRSLATKSHGGVFEPESARAHKSVESEPKHPELLSDAHSQRRMRRLLFGIVCGLGAMGLVAFGEIPSLRAESQDSKDRSSLSSLNLRDQAHRFKPPVALSSADISRVLHADAFEVHQPGVQGVTRYDSARVVSNGPTEDVYDHQSLRVSSSPSEWMAWGVYDGHAGSQVSRILGRTLMPYVAAELSKLYSDSDPSEAELGPTVDNAIKRAFVSLDEDLMSPAALALTNGAMTLAEKAATLSVGYSGSCALLSLYDPSSRTLRVANTGDSRAVLGTRSNDGVWTAQALSVDQNGENDSELARLEAAHPNEPEMVKGKRLLGLAVTRAFGDGRWKWDAATQDQAHQEYKGPRPRPHLLTPPYLTAEPEVSTTQLEGSQPSFLIMASDGLWDHMSSQQAVELVGRWLSWNTAGRPAEEAAPSAGFAPFSFAEEEDDESTWQVREEWATARDNNAAAHLVRNALGGRNETVLGAVLAWGPPWSRDVRDDITVTVVFFGDGWGSALPGPPGHPVQAELADR